MLGSDANAGRRLPFVWIKVNLRRRGRLGGGGGG